MKTLTELIVSAGLGDRLFNEHQLARLLGGSAGRRYGIVNRALKSGELIRYQRGLYSLGDTPLHKVSIHPYYLAQSLKPGSYISLESALAYHGWIPEAVFVTASITPGRKSKEYVHETLGKFNFYALATQKGYFLELVSRVELNEQTTLIAEPMRALMDLVCFKKIEWQGLDWITEGMRIDNSYLKKVTQEEVMILSKVYKHNQVLQFLKSLASELEIMKND